MNWEKIVKYIESEYYKKDLKAAKEIVSGWLDVSYRFNLCSGCIIVGENNRVDIFDTMFRVENYKIEQIEKLKEVIEGWDDVIKEIKIIMGNQEYQKLIEKKRGHIEFNRYARDGRTLDYIELKWNNSLVDYVLGLDIIGNDSIIEQIEAINNIDDELYAVGEVFCNHLKSVLFSRYFILKKDPGTGKYCIKFEYSNELKLESIDQKLSMLFGNRNKLYVKNAEELDVLMGLIE